LAGAHACACVKAEEVSLTVSNIAMLGDRSPVSRYIYRSVVIPDGDIRHDLVRRIGRFQHSVRLDRDILVDSDTTT